jgi:hypothetical protein
LPIVKADADIASAISLKHDGGVQDTAIAGKANTVHSHSPSDVVGTAVITSDSRLSDSRPASDVSTWAKASVKPTYTTAEVSDSTDKRYCTDAQKTVIGNTSGNNSGDETASTIKTKLGITTLSGSNTGDQTVPVVATVTPVMDGVATIGASGKWADGAHIHPVDTSRAASSHTHAESDVTNLTTDLAAKAPLNSPSLVTPNIGAAIGTSLAATGAVTSSGAGIGYATGAGGTVTQGSSRTTGVTLSKLCGTITMFSAAVAAAASSTFTLTNTFIAANDILKVTHNSATNPCCWICEAICAAGSASIIVKNVSAASITEATPLKYVLIKGVSS